MELTNEDKLFITLHERVAADLCTLGAYEPASDNEDDEYDELYCHSKNPTALYILRKSNATGTLVISAQDFEKRDIAINSIEEWEQIRLRLTAEGGLPLETVPPEEVAALIQASRRED
jgi:hypothetical protein